MVLNMCLPGVNAQECGRKIAGERGSDSEGARWVGKPCLSCADLDDGCKRTSRACGPLFATASGVYEDGQFLACSGAKIADIRIQLFDIEEYPDLITLTAGGNGVGFFDVLVSCLLAGDIDPRVPAVAGRKI